MNIEIKNNPKIETDRPEYKNQDTFGLVNFITELMERNYIEIALELINQSFSKLSLLEKEMLTLNILEATKQYNISSDLLPESYYNFLTSEESNHLFW